MIMMTAIFRFIKLIKIADVDVKVIQDKNFMRVSDEKVLIGDNTRLKSLGWKQKYTIEETLEQVFNDWMKRV